MQLNTRTELVGRRFGKLEVLGPGPIVGNTRRSCWLCKCDCGVVKSIRECVLLGSGAYSCGCLAGQHIREDSNIETALLKDKWGKAKVWRYSMYKYAAKARNHSFELSPQEFDTLTRQDCFYCGAPPSNIAKVPARDAGTRRSEPIKYNGLDRVDNTKGYVMDNVVPCCKLCNPAKHANTKEVFISWVRRVYNKSVQEHIEI